MMRFSIKFLVIPISLLLLNSCSETKLVEPVKEKILYTIHKALSAGNSWRQVYTFPTHTGKHTFYLSDVSCDDNGYIYASTFGGLYKINPSDSSAVILKNGLFNTIVETDTFQIVSTVLFNDNRLIAGVTNLENFGGIFISDDYGITFQNKVPIFEYANIVSLYKSPSGEIFAGCYMDIYRSTDNGYTWTSELAYTEAGFAYFYSFAFDKYGDIYGATRRGVYYSDSRQINFKSIGLTNETILGIDINSLGWIYALTETGKMFVSKDSGKTWQQISSFPNYGTHCVYINHDDYIFAGTADGIYRSKDFGSTWELVGCQNEWIIRIISDSNGNMIAGDYGNKIYYSNQ